MKKSEADEYEDYIFLRSLLPSIIKLDDIQRLELRIEFLSSVTRRIQISKNLSPPFSSVPTTSNVSCPPTPSPHATSLASTHSRLSDAYIADVTYLKLGFPAMSVSSCILRTY